MTGLILALALILVLGLAERLERDRCFRAIPVRVLVNGTRGKSTVTRLIRAGIAASGTPAFAKTTGTQARFIFPDGSEKPVRRLATANIREQLRALSRARRSGARAVVLECMALKPELQWSCEHEMLRSTVGVITNARPDHTEIMGKSVDDIARTLANTIPRGGVLVAGEGRFGDLCREQAAKLGTRLVVAGKPAGGESVARHSSEAVAAGAASGVADPSAPDAEPAWWLEDAGIALAVTREFGIPDDVALGGMRAAMPDPGALAWLRLPEGTRSGTGRSAGPRGEDSESADSAFPECSPGTGAIFALDAAAANDPESLFNLVADCVPADKALLFVYHHRADRARRLADFRAGLTGEVGLTGAGKSPPLLQGRTLWFLVTGERPRFAAKGKEGSLPLYVPGRKAGAVVAGFLAAFPEERRPAVILCGNTKGFRLREAALSASLPVNAGLRSGKENR